MNRLLAHRLLCSPIDVPIDGTIPFTLSQDLLVPTRLGVYLIHDLRGVLYVGRSTNLKRRFNEHFWQPSNPLLKAALSKPVGKPFFSWVIADWDRMEDIEKQLIRWFDPPCNRILYTT